MEYTEKSGSQSSSSQDLFSSQWRQMRGTLRSWWGKLTDNDWERIAGQKDKLLGMLQEKYGYTRDMALHEIERRFGEYSQQSSNFGRSSGSMPDQLRQNPDTPGLSMATAGKSTQPNYRTASGSEHTASNMMHTAQTKAQEINGHVTDGMAQAKSTVGKKMGELADSLRRNTPQQGGMESAANAVADRLSAAGSYLEGHTFEDMTTDMSSLIRRYPIQALLIGIGIGYFLSRGMER